MVSALAGADGATAGGVLSSGFDAPPSTPHKPKGRIADMTQPRYEELVDLLRDTINQYLTEEVDTDDLGDAGHAKVYSSYDIPAKFLGTRLEDLREYDLEEIVNGCVPVYTGDILDAAQDYRVIHREAESELPPGCSLGTHAAILLYEALYEEALDHLEYLRNEATEV